VTLLQQFHKVS